MNLKTLVYFLIIAIITTQSCNSAPDKQQETKKIRVILDTDANNELDDQHALALEKSPGISKKIRLVCLGSNYPEPGEYNLENDTSALSCLLESDIHFEMVTVSYGRPSGTDYIKVSVPDIDSIMPGKGPHIEGSITGRHGGRFSNFGDYSVSLFHNIDVYGDPPSRALFDVGAVVIVKNAEWADSSSIPAPSYVDNAWVEHPENQRTIIIWEYFKKELIIADFYAVLE